MADNTEHFAFIQMVQGNLSSVRDDFVWGDLLWYPVEGHPEIRVAPDVLVAVGRPRGHRGSYRQWEEQGVPLTVVFEWWSPNAAFPQMLKKYRFYDRHGVTEFITFDQRSRELNAWRRIKGVLEPVSTEGGYESEVLGIRMDVVQGDFKAWHTDGRPFLTWEELEAERKAVTAERDAALERAAALEARLQAMGISLD